jgi:ribosomal protein S6--L-glutamate ligase
VIDVVVVHYASQRAANWKLLQQAAEAKDVRLTTWEPHRIELLLSDESTETFYGGRRADPRVLLHRTVSPFQGLFAAAADHWRHSGTVILNEVEASFRSRDKVLTTIALRDSGVPVVTTLSFDEPDPRTLHLLPDGDLIIKPAHGVRGEGIEAYSSANAVAQAWGLRGARTRRRSVPGYHMVREHYLAQPLIGGGGSDLRAYVVGGNCVGLMRRRARPGEIRANLELGASGEPLDLAHPAAATATTALRACALDYGGVDLIEDDEGIVRVLEVDAWAGFAGITSCTGADVAGAILDLALRRRADGGAG